MEQDARRGQVVGEGVHHYVSLPEAGGPERLGKPLDTFMLDWLIDGTGRSKDTVNLLRGYGGEAAVRRMSFLSLDEVSFSGDGKLFQVLCRLNLCRAYAGSVEQFFHGRGVAAGVGYCLREFLIVVFLSRLR